MQIHARWLSHKLKFRFPFRIAHGQRTHTDVVYLQLSCTGAVGYGEAALPPYLPNTVATTIAFFEKILSAGFEMPDSIPDFMSALGKKYEGEQPAKAALDVALWNLKASIEKTSLQNILTSYTSIIRPFGEGSKRTPHTYTIGICLRDEMKLKIEHGLENGFRFFKLKLNGMDDDRILSDFKSLSDLPFAIDANQGWSNPEHAISFSKQLETSGCILIEQPFHKSDRENSRRLKSELKIPVIADEACQGLDDIESLTGSFSGINIKLQKCGGLSDALKMIARAKSLNLKILIGCMSESGVGCNAAEVLAPLCEWADLDGPWLIENDPRPGELFR